MDTINTNDIYRTNLRVSTDEERLYESQDISQQEERKRVEQQRKDLERRALENQRQ